MLPDVTMKGFQRCCISNAMDGNDDDMLWKSSEEDRQVRSLCVEDKRTDCKDGDNDSVW